MPCACTVLWCECGLSSYAPHIIDVVALRTCGRGLPNQGAARLCAKRSQGVSIGAGLRVHLRRLAGGPGSLEGHARRSSSGAYQRATSSHEHRRVPSTILSIANVCAPRWLSASGVCAATWQAHTICCSDHSSRRTRFSGVPCSSARFDSSSDPPTPISEVLQVAEQRFWHVLMHLCMPQPLLTVKSTISHPAGLVGMRDITWAGPPSFLRPYVVTFRGPDRGLPQVRQPAQRISAVN